MTDLDAFYADARTLIGEFDSFAETHGLKGVAASDHICFKCGSRDEYERIRSMLEPEAQYLHQSIISKRRIAIVKLMRPFPSVLGDITVLELSDQKPDGSQKSGFDHIEVFPSGVNYEELVSKIEDDGVLVTKVERPHHTTHDIDLAGGFVFRLTQGPLLDKIKQREM